MPGQSLPVSMSPLPHPAPQPPLGNLPGMYAINNATASINMRCYRHAFFPHIPRIFPADPYHRCGGDRVTPSKVYSSVLTSARRFSDVKINYSSLTRDTPDRWYPATTSRVV